MHPCEGGSRQCEYYEGSVVAEVDEGGGEGDIGICWSFDGFNHVSCVSCVWIRTT